MGLNDASQEDRSKALFNEFEPIKRELMFRAADLNITITGVEFIAPYEWSPWTAVYIFTEGDVELKRWQENGVTEVLKSFVIESLLKYQFPVSLISEVTFTFDSDQNVRKNFGGSYFNRMR